MEGQITIYSEGSPGETRIFKAIAKNYDDLIV